MPQTHSDKPNAELRKRLRDHDPAHPPRNWAETEAEAFGDWSKAPLFVRLHIVKRSAEGRRGVAIQKDRMCKRGKYALDGWFGLELAEEDLYRLACSEKPDQSKLADAAERVTKLREQLAADEITVQEKLELSEAWDRAEPIAASHNMTVPEWLAACVGVEEQLRADVIGGIFAICDHMKVDPLAVLAQALQPQQRAG